MVRGVEEIGVSFNGRGPRQLPSQVVRPLVLCHASSAAPVTDTAAKPQFAGGRIYEPPVNAIVPAGAAINNTCDRVLGVVVEIRGDLP